jgi:hypothetical protein
MKFYAHRIKYVIAREGLIIISLLLVAAISYYINSWEIERLDNYVKDSKEITLVRNGNPNGMRAYMDGLSYRENPFDKIYGPENHYTVPGIKAQFPSSSDQTVIEHTMEKDFKGPLSRFTAKEALDGWVPLNSPTNTDINARYDDKGNKLFTGFLWNIDFLKVMTFFLFIAYPVYLLIRFVVWAVVTVKTQRSAHS